MISVFVEETGKKIGFPDSTPKDEIDTAVRGHVYGEIRQPETPLETFYNNTFRPIVDKVESVVNPQFISRENEPAIWKAFRTSHAKEASFGIIDIQDPENIAENPIASFVGSLTGTVQAIAQTGGVAGALGLGRAALRAGVGVMEAVGRGAVGQVAGKVTARAVSGAGIGALYGAVKSGTEETKKVIDGAPADVVKIGTEVFKDAFGEGLFFGSVSGVGVAFRSVPIGSAAVAGTGYLALKLQGHDDADAVIGGVGIGLMHGLFAPRIPAPRNPMAEAEVVTPKMIGAQKTETPGFIDATDAEIVTAWTNVKAAYIKAKNPMINEHLALRLAQEHTMVTKERLMLPAPVAGGKVVEVEPARLKRDVYAPRTGGNPNSDKWSAQIRYKGWAWDEKFFDTEAEARAYVDDYKFKEMSDEMLAEYGKMMKERYERTGYVASPDTIDVKGEVVEPTASQIVEAEVKEILGITDDMFPEVKAKEKALVAPPTQYEVVNPVGDVERVYDTAEEAKNNLEEGDVIRERVIAPQEQTFEDFVYFNRDSGYSESELKIIHETAVKKSVMDGSLRDIGDENYEGILADYEDIYADVMASYQTAEKAKLEPIFGTETTDPRLVYRVNTLMADIGKQLKVVGEVSADGRSIVVSGAQAKEFKNRKGMFGSPLDAVKEGDNVRLSLPSIGAVTEKTAGADIAKMLADRLGQPVQAFHKKFAEAIVEKDAEFIVQAVAHAKGHNENSKSVFTDVTGVKLPSTIQGKREAVYAWAGKEMPKPVEKAPEPPKMSKEEATKKMLSAKAEKVLETRIKYDGVIMTKKELIDKLVADGWTPDVSQENKIKDPSRRRYNNMDGRQQEEFERRQKEAGMKSVYYIRKGVMAIEIGKVGHDYAVGKITEKPAEPYQLSPEEIAYRKALKPVESVAQKPTASKQEPKRASFKVKVGAEWRVPKASISGKKGSEIKLSDSKAITAEKSIKIITDSLDDAKMTTEGEYVIITGIPKEGGRVSSAYGYGKGGGEGMGSTGGQGIESYEKRSFFAKSNLPKQEKNFKLFEATKQLAKKYAARIGEGWVPKPWLGVFYPNTKNVFFESLNDISVIVHEVTHYLDNKHGTSPALMKVVGYTKDGKPKYDQSTRKERKELTEAYTKYYPGGSKDHKLEKRMTEGLAVFVQRMIEQPTQTVKEFPTLVQAFLEPNGRFFDPIYNELISDAHNVIAEYQNLDDLSKIGSKITREANKTKKEAFSWRDRFIQEVFDSVRPVEVLAERGGVKGTTADPSLWVREYNNLASIIQNNIHPGKGYISVVDGEFMKVYKENWGDLVEELHKAGLEEQFDSWLVARRTYYDFKALKEMEDELALVETNAKAREAMEEEGMDIDDQVAGIVDTEYISDLKSKISKKKALLAKDEITEEMATNAHDEYRDQFKQYADKFDKLVRADLDFLASREVQLVTPKQYEEMIKNEGYATKMRDAYNEVLGDAFAPAGVGRKSGVASLKRRTGSNLTVISPVQASLRNHAEALRKGMRQIVYNRITDIAKSIPDLFQPTKLERVRKPDGTVMYPQEMDKEIIMGRKDYKRYPVFVNAEVKQVIDELITPVNFGAVERGLVAVSRMFTKGTTGYYIPFALTNFTIDQFAAAAQTQNNYRPIIDQIDILKKFMADDKSIESRYLQEYLMLGGERQTFANWLDMSANEFIEALNHEKSNLGKAIQGAETVADILAMPIRASELLTRGVEYIKARKRGINQLAALEMAGRVSAPFHHIGRLGNSSFTRATVKSIPYLNASTQVLGQYVDTLTRDPESRKRAVYVAMIIGAAMIGGLASIFFAASDDQKRAYKALTPYMLANNVFFPHPSNKEKLVKIRIPNQMAIGATITNMMVSDFMFGTKYRPLEYVDAATSWIPDNVNVTNPARLVFSWIPRYISPMVEVATNTVSYPNVRPLESMSDRNLPDKYRTKENTSLYARWLGEKLDISPIKIDHLVEGYIGRTVRFADMVIGLVAGEKAKKIDNPFETEMYLSGARQLQNYYNLKERISQIESADRKGLAPISDEEAKMIGEAKPIVKSIEKLMKVYKKTEITDKNSEELFKMRAEILDLVDVLP
jgi:hypothetical protein